MHRNSSITDGPTYNVTPNPAALRDLRRFQLIGRDPRLPEFYEYIGNHPLRPSPQENDTEYGRTMVYFVDTTPVGKLLALELGKQIVVPYGRLDTMKAKAPGTKPTAQNSCANLILFV